MSRTFRLVLVHLAFPDLVSVRANGETRTPTVLPTGT